MENLFGRLLRTRMGKAGIKESELAEFLSYDATYISKWINGSKLPSARNAQRICSQIAEFFASRENDGKDRNVLQRQIASELFSAWKSDSSYFSFQGYSNYQMSFTDSRQTLVELTGAALQQAVNREGRTVEMAATFDIFRLYGGEFKRLVQSLHDSGVSNVRLKMALNTEHMAEDYSYVTNILNTIGRLDYIEMTIVCQKAGQPRILLINDLLCLQILWNDGVNFAAAFSMEPRVIESFSQMCEQILETAPQLLEPAQPENLKRTNAQLDSYSDQRQWLFFNEPPAMLFPDDIMDSMIREADDEEYASYLMKLKNVFSKRTRKSHIDLVFFSSMLNQYLSDGKVNVGNVSHQLTGEQTRRHLAYLSRVMTENPDFNVWLIRDTVRLNEELRQMPSIFLDSYALSIENSKITSNSNFHISMDSRMRDGFQHFFEKILTMPSCIRLTAEDLLRDL